MGCVSHGGASVLMGGFKKNRRMGGVGGGGEGTSLWETLYMENFTQIMDDSKQ